MWIKRILLVVISSIFALLILEIFFRYYFYRWNTNQSVPFSMFSRPFPNADNLDKLIVESSDPKILFELMRNSNTDFKGKPFVTNSEGVLGASEYAHKKPNNTIRIVGVGDSIMSSWGVNPDATYLSVLERELSKIVAPKQVQVINLSVPGYNTAIEAAIIEKKALQYDPDLIVLGFCGNDIDLPNFIRKKVIAGSYLHFVTNTAIDMIKASLNNIDRADVGIQPLVFSPMSVENPYRFAHEIGDAPPEYRYMVGISNYITSMKKISDMTTRAGVPVLLVQYSFMVPDLTEIQNMGFHIIIINDLVSKHLRDAGLSDDDIIQGNGDYHLNEFGHSLYAKYLYEYILADPELQKIFK